MVASTSAAPPAVVLPAAVGFAVGSRVTLAAGYESSSDASSGPLRPGDEGAVVELGDKRLKVQAKTGAKSGSSWWYDIPAIQLKPVSLFFRHTFNCNHLCTALTPRWNCWTNLSLQ